MRYNDRYIQDLLEKERTAEHRIADQKVKILAAEECQNDREHRFIPGENVFGQEEERMPVRRPVFGKELYERLRKAFELCADLFRLDAKFFAASVIISIFTFCSPLVLWVQNTKDRGGAPAIFDDRSFLGDRRLERGRASERAQLGMRRRHKEKREARSYAVRTGQPARSSNKR